MSLLRVEAQPAHQQMRTWKEAMTPQCKALGESGIVQAFFSEEIRPNDVEQQVEQRQRQPRNHVHIVFSMHIVAYSMT